MTKTIDYLELCTSSSAILQEVANGQTFTITEEGRPVAVLAPINDAPTQTLRVQPATIVGQFSEIQSHTSSRPSAEILEELREER